METLQTVLTRRSASRLTDPAPADPELLDLVGAAMTAPDHGRLRPWRLVTLRGAERAELGERLADCAGEDPVARGRAAAKALRAPLLIAIVLSPVDHPKVRRWEQLACATAVVHTLSLLLHDRDYASIWRTGPAAEDDGVRALHGVAEGEQLLGWLYVGTPSGGAAPRSPQDPAECVRPLSRFTGPGGGTGAE